MTAGERVSDGRRTGEVRHVGRCGWSHCPHGDSCVTIWFDGGFTSENRSSDQLSYAE